MILYFHYPFQIQILLVNLKQIILTSIELPLLGFFVHSCGLKVRERSTANVLFVYLSLINNLSSRSSEDSIKLDLSLIIVLL